MVWSENVFGCKMRQKLKKIKNISHVGFWTQAYRLGGCYAYHTTTETQVSRTQIFLNTFFIKIAANSKFVVASTYPTSVHIDDNCPERLKWQQHSVWCMGWHIMNLAWQNSEWCLFVCNKGSLYSWDGMNGDLDAPRTDLGYSGQRCDISTMTWKLS